MGVSTSRGVASGASGRLRVSVGRNAIWLVFYGVFFAAFAISLGNDGSPDFRIYHFYNGFAAVSGGRPGDVAAAQLQSFLFPALDALYFLVERALDAHPTLLCAVLSLPYAVAAWLVFLIADAVLPGAGAGRSAVAGFAALFGLTGAAGLATLGTAMTEVVPAVPSLLGLLVWLGVLRGSRTPLGGAALAGVIAGAAVGLKLTEAAYFAALIGTMLVASAGMPFRIRVQAVLIAGIAGFLTVCVIDGAWWLRSWRLYANPLFPYYNQIFRSEFASPGSYADTRFFPHGTLMTLFYPAWWAFSGSMRASELNVRDPRLLLGMLGCASVLVRAIVGPRGDQARRGISVCVPVYFLLGLAFWEHLFSIYRYAEVLEALSGILIAAGILAWTPVPRMRRALPPILLIFALAAAWTQYPWWSRAASAAHAVEVAPLPFEGDATVVLLDPYAYSYLVPFMPSGVRVIGANINLFGPGQQTRLARDAADAIASARGPIWGLQDHPDFPGAADATLAFHHLSRGECVTLRTNIEPDRIQACRLTRVQGGP